MHMGRVSLGQGHALKPEVVVPVRLLRCPTRPHNIDLRCHLEVRTQPRLGGGNQYGISVIAREYGRSSQAKLLLRVPDAVIGARLGEVISDRGASFALVMDDGFEDLR